VYYLWQPHPFSVPQTRVRDHHGTLLKPDGTVLRADYVLSDGPVVEGEAVASRPEASLTLYRVGGKVRIVGGGT
jgi:hypothetical protein